MAATVVYEGVPNTQGVTGTLFAGQKFWFSAQVPQRSWFLENVKANGGEVVQLEKQADILLVDHKRKNAAPGTHSYKYVELSIRNGRLENLEDHVVGGTSRTDRPVGSVTMAPKGGRNNYTEAEDQLLWNWLKPLEDAGAATAGNEIYKQLETRNPRHTYQSWRDRWLKYVKFQNREITSQVRVEKVAAQIQASPRRPVRSARPGSALAGSRDSGRRQATQQQRSPQQRRLARESVEDVVESLDGTVKLTDAITPSAGKEDQREEVDWKQYYHKVEGFTEEDFEDLFLAAEEIVMTNPNDAKMAWEQVAHSRARHDADKWRSYFHFTVQPGYTAHVQKELKQARKVATPRKTAPAVPLPVRGTPKRDNSLTTPSKDSRHRRSPSFHPDYPVQSSFVANQDRAPGPNEARKRIAGKGSNSQESTNSASQPGQSPKRKRDVDSEVEELETPSLPPYGNQERAKRRKKHNNDPVNLEIPPTPEHETVGRPADSDKTSEEDVEPGSPTPRPRRSPRNASGPSNTPSSSLFVLHDQKPQNSRWSRSPSDIQSSSPIDGEHSIPPSTPRRLLAPDQEPKTSPLSVRLVSDRDPPEISGSSQSQHEANRDGDTGSPTPEFETAPQSVSQVWETAQNENVGVGRVETQALFQESVGATETLEEDEFALPEPEGGWDDLLLPPGVASASDVDAMTEGGQSDSSDNSLQVWMTAHQFADPNADDGLLLSAINASNADLAVADMVYDLLKQGIDIPKNFKGVWTEEDDLALRGNDPQAIKRVEDKHGKETLAGRWQWLES